MAKITALTELAEADVVAADVLVVVDVGSSATKKIKISNIGGAIDGDHLDIDFTPTYYTPATTPAEAADVDDLAAHLQGIDNEINTINTEVGTKISDDTAGEIVAITEKTVPVAADEILIEDSADSNNKKSLKLGNLGIVVEGNRPTFYVKLAAEQANIAIDSGVTILFATEITDIGSNFNPATYTFTSPITGNYLLTYHVYINDIDSAATYYRIELVTSNRTTYYYIDPDFGQDAAYWSLTLSGVFDMDINDTAVVKIRQAAGAQQADIQSSSFFSGALV